MSAVTGRAEQKPVGAGSAGPPRPAIAGSISMESKGVNVLAEAANALVPTLLLLLLLLQLLLLQQSNPVCTRAWADALPPPHPAFHPSINLGSRGPYCVPGPGLGTGHLTHSPRGRSGAPPFLLPWMGAAGGGFHRRKVQKAQTHNPGERRRRPGARVSGAPGRVLWRSGGSAALSAAPFPGPSPLQRGSSLASARGEGGATRDLKVHRLRSGARICSRRPRPD